MAVSPEQLESLTREELLALLKALLPEFELLRQRVAGLEAENERLKQQLTGSTTSRNSSQPPSRDQKTNQPEKKCRKHGPPFGHQKYSRPLVDNPDQVIQVPVPECEQCLSNLKNIQPEDFERRQIVELPEVSPVVIETRQHRTTCPECQTLNRAILPEGLEAERCFGPNLEATVIFYKQTQHLSYERIVETMRNLHGVILSEGAIASILRRAGEKAQPVAEAINEQVISGEVIRSDETSARVKARNWWQWVFISEQGVYHTIVPTRSFAEITEVMGQLAVKAWVSDCYSAQLKAPAEVFQLCLAHQLRDLQRVLDASPEEFWALTAQKLFRVAIHLRNRFLSGEMTLSGFPRRVTQLENELDSLLEEELQNETARRLQNRFSTHRDKLLTFLHYPNVPPTNNESEQALRSSVIHRKVTNGFRSEWGAKAYAALQTILVTAKQKGEQAFQTLAALMGTPVIHFVEASSP
ncbi:MAG: IS66 family transposase [Acidobacteriota bacterium]|nr:IS66 family transposase [Acidobacteriota bacterium]